jgi:hypothetical protein
VRRHLITLLTLVPLLAAGATACGSSNDERQSGVKAQAESRGQAEQSAEGLPAADLERVVEAEDRVNALCHLAGDEAGADLPITEAIRIFRDVYRMYPDATYARPEDAQPRNMKRVVVDNVRRLRHCGKAAEATELERVLKG